MKWLILGCKTNATIKLPITKYKTIMAKIKVKQVKSGIKRPQNQKRTLEALGLRKIGQVVEHDDTPNILGMINKVKHLVSTEA
ncbi:LSU ribosomal protein L30p (L7e) [hydrothermal vent metagenome]|uniref:LSU ribosomal protein L30p (L7e) n=1 Tax=hydrothermal vent metagenome TaxID=652676 RepID=A0A3B0TKL6_9ZZZZ